MLEMHIELSEIDELNHTLKEDNELKESEIKRLIEEKEDLEEEVRIRNKEMYDINSKIKKLEIDKYSKECSLKLIEKELESILKYYFTEKNKFQNFKANYLNSNQNQSSDYNSLNIDNHNHNQSNNPSNLSDPSNPFEIPDQIKNEISCFKELLNKYEVFFSINHRKFKNIVKILLKTGIDSIDDKSTSKKLHNKEDSSNLINLNINKNININFFSNKPSTNLQKSKSLHRKSTKWNSFSFFKCKDIKDIVLPKAEHNIIRARARKSVNFQDNDYFNSNHNNTNNIQSCSPNHNNHNNPNSNNSNNNSNINAMSRENSFKNRSYIDNYSNSFDIMESLKQEDSLIKDEYERNNSKIKTLNEKNNGLEKEIIELQNELTDKDSKLKNNFITIKEYEDKINNNNQIISNMIKKIENEKSDFLKDLSYKDKQILKLHEKINELEDMNFKLTNFNKDKKKFYAMEIQAKELTNAFQQVKLFVCLLICLIN